MFHAIKSIRLIYVFFSVLMSFFICGCFWDQVIGSGYSVRIKINIEQFVSVEVLNEIENKIMHEEFDLQPVLQKEEITYRRYIKNLFGPKFDHLPGCKFVTLMISYELDPTQNYYLKNFEIMIRNDCVGQDITVKTEINRISELFYHELYNKYGDSVHIEGRRTSLPF